VYHIVNVRMRLKDLPKCFLIRDIEVHKVRPLPTNQFNAIDDLFRRIVQVICNDNFVAGFEESQGRERSNVAGTAIIAGLGMEWKRRSHGVEGGRTLLREQSLWTF
jgi:hypothetical protein